MRPAAIAIGLWLILQTAESTRAQSPRGGQSRPQSSGDGRSESIEELPAQPAGVRTSFRPENRKDQVQQGGAPASGGILDNRVDKLLEDWSKRTAKIKSLYATFEKTTEDRVWRAKEVASGSARYLYPNKARLDQEGQDAESYVLTGTEVWHYRVPLKQIKVYELPKEMQNQKGLQDGPLPFLFAAEPNQAKARYRFKIVSDDAKIVQIEIAPKFEEDRENFSQAVVWLDREQFLPKQIFFVEPNGNQVTFKFTGIWTNIELKESDFAGQKVEGWQVMRQKVGDQKGRRNAALTDKSLDR